MKTQITQWEEIFGTYITEKRLISKIYKELLTLVKEKESNREGMDKILEQAFHKIGQFHMANKYLKRGSVLLSGKCQLN